MALVPLTAVHKFCDLVTRPKVRDTQSTDYFGLGLAKFILPDKKANQVLLFQKENQWLRGFFLLDLCRPQMHAYILHLIMS